MTSDRLRSEFLNFFEKKDHKVIPSDSLVPQHDPTLLFTGAGMNQFKEQFLGRNITFKRAATCQKCLRTADLEKVGKTLGHHTFFEMLGNFSFGDYFKKEAIMWAWEFLTERLNLPKERLWASVYRGDEEAYDIWKNAIKLPVERIAKLSDKENFWPSEAKTKGPNGPCGPCSEIFYDWGAKAGCGKSTCNPACECGRFVEIWNLVFTQFNRKEGGILEDLPKKNIDTGMGLERLTAVAQGVLSNFQIDSFKTLIKTISKQLRCNYGRDKENDSHINAIADHARAITFAIGDGVRPSNESRGFVIRKLIRKSSQRARSIGFEDPFMYRVVPVVLNVVKRPYPELSKLGEDITQVVLKEEESLKDILDTVLPFMESEFEDIKKNRKPSVSGKLIFKYYDEKGIPLDLIEEKAAQSNLGLDMDEFDKLLEDQRRRSRQASKLDQTIFVEKLFSDKTTEFIPDASSVDAKLLAISKKGEFIHVALDKTVFYGEAGGQVGDNGLIEGPTFKIEIKDAKRYENIIDHVGRVVKGEPKVGDKVKVQIDLERRSRIAKNHTATHLLHAALKKVLGSHVNQYGSLVAPERLRFDFTYSSKLDEHQIERIESFVNEFIRKGCKMESREMELQKAKDEGAIALFGEKYADTVTVRSIGEVSKELCGGTHVKNTNQIGIFKVISEGSVASGVRRIEALTGEAVYSWMKKDIDQTLRLYTSSLKKIKSLKDKELKNSLERIEQYLKPQLIKIDSLMEKNALAMSKTDLDLWVNTLKPELMRAISDLNNESKDIQKRQKQSRRFDYRSKVDQIIKESKKFQNITIVSRRIEDADVDDLRGLMDIIKQKTNSAAIVLAAVKENRVNIIFGLTKDLVSSGLSATRLVKEVASMVGGSGGGRPDLAQAGGRDPQKLEKALDLVYDIIKREVSK